MIEVSILPFPAILLLYDIFALFHFMKQPYKRPLYIFVVYDLCVCNNF